MRNRVVIIIPSSSIYHENSLIPITWNLEIHDSKISRVKNAKIPVKRREGGDKVSRLRLNSKAPNPPPRSSSGVKMGQKAYLSVPPFIYLFATHASSFFSPPEMGRPTQSRGEGIHNRHVYPLRSFDRFISQFWQWTRCRCGSPRDKTREITGHFPARNVFQPDFPPIAPSPPRTRAITHCRGYYK